MSAKGLFFSEDKVFTPEEKMAYQREGLIYNITEDLLVIMEEKDVSRKALADALGKTKSYVSQLLTGSRNMTLNTLSDICFALGVKPQIAFDGYNKHAAEAREEEIIDPEVHVIYTDQLAEMEWSELPVFSLEAHEFHVHMRQAAMNESRHIDLDLKREGWGAVHKKDPRKIAA